MNEQIKGNPPSAEALARWTFWLTFGACLTFTLIVAVFVL